MSQKVSQNSLFYELPPEQIMLQIPMPKNRTIICGETIQIMFGGAGMSPKVPGKPEIPPHRHNIEQISIVQSGECELEIETEDPKVEYYSLPSEFVGQPTEKKTIKAGDWFRVPSGCLHSLRVIKGPCSHLSIYHPVRPEYNTGGSVMMKRKMDMAWLETPHHPNPFKLACAEK